MQQITVDHMTQSKQLLQGCTVAEGKELHMAEDAQNQPVMNSVLKE